jgi:hypothetical protein
VVLADGAVREVGSHEELLARNDLYADLYALSTRGLAGAQAAPHQGAKISR